METASTSCDNKDMESCAEDGDWGRRCSGRGSEAASERRQEGEAPGLSQTGRSWRAEPWHGHAGQVEAGTAGAGFGPDAGEERGHEVAAPRPPFRAAPPREATARVSLMTVFEAELSGSQHGGLRGKPCSTAASLWAQPSRVPSLSRNLRRPCFLGKRSSGVSRGRPQSRACPARTAHPPGQHSQPPPRPTDRPSCREDSWRQSFPGQQQCGHSDRSPPVGTTWHHKGFPPDEDAMGKEGRGFTPSLPPRRAAHPEPSITTPTLHPIGALPATGHCASPGLGRLQPRPCSLPRPPPAAVGQRVSVPSSLC